MSELVDCINSLSAKDIIKSVAKTANGVPFYIQTNGLSGFCAEFQAVRDAYVGTIPDAIQLEAQNTMACGLVAAGVWAKLDVLFVMANGDSPNCLLNWINPGTFTLIPVNAPTFTAWEGIQGGGVDEYTNCPWIPSVNGVNYTANSASYGIYSRSNVDENSIDAGANSLTSDSLLWLRNAGDASIRINSINTSAGANADSLGFYVVNKEDLTVAQDLWKNKVKIIDDTKINQGLPTVAFFIAAQNNIGVPASFSTRQYSMFFAGAGLTQTEIENFTDIFEVYMDFLGNGVIP